MTPADDRNLLSLIERALAKDAAVSACAADSNQAIRHYEANNPFSQDKIVPHVVAKSTARINLAAEEEQISSSRIGGTDTDDRGERQEGDRHEREG
jgi:hypothetical protein